MTFFSDFIMSHLMWFWLAVMIACLIVEAITFQLTTVWAALSSFLMIFISRTEIAFKWQLIIFLVLTIAFIIFTRPFVMKKLKLGKNVTNVNTLEGQEVLVTKAVSQFAKGEAKAKNGVIWTVSAATGEEISEGTVCIVIKVDGNTLSIKPKE